MPFSRILSLLDKFRTMVNVSGRGTAWCPLWIILTSNDPPQQWYDPRRVTMPALLRRIHWTTEVKSKSSTFPLFNGHAPSSGPASEASGDRSPPADLVGPVLRSHGRITRFPFSVENVMSAPPGAE